MTPIEIECGYCRAQPGEACRVTKRTRSVRETGYHRSRVCDAASGRQAPPATASPAAGPDEPLQIMCSYCHVAPGEACRNAAGPVDHFHAARRMRVMPTRRRPYRRRVVDRPILHHGLSYLPEYRAWQLIRLRCLDPKHAAFPRYGGRGITLWPAWVNDPAAFVAHVGRRPTPKHEIDRIDNERGYEPENLRWATRTENSRNRRNNRPLTYRGETKTQTEWCHVFGVREDTLRQRLKRGMTVEAALETPVAPTGPRPKVAAANLQEAA
jgi:hypothetical protein